MALALPLRDLLLWGLVPFLRTRGYSALPVHFLGKAATFNLLYAFPLLLLGDGTGVVAALADVFGWAFAIWGIGLYWWAGVLYAYQVYKLAPGPRPPGRDAPMTDLRDESAAVRHRRAGHDAAARADHHPGARRGLRARRQPASRPPRTPAAPPAASLVDVAGGHRAGRRAAWRSPARQTSQQAVDSQSSRATLISRIDARRATPGGDPGAGRPAAGVHHQLRGGRRRVGRRAGTALDAELRRIRVRTGYAPVTRPRASGSSSTTRRTAWPTRPCATRTSRSWSTACGPPGAEAIAINGQRLTVLTFIQNSGPVDQRQLPAADAAVHRRGDRRPAHPAGRPAGVLQRRAVHRPRPKCWDSSSTGRMSTSSSCPAPGSAGCGTPRAGESGNVPRSRSRKGVRRDRRIWA